MYKKAEHQIDVCLKCNGTGEIIGPKMVELTEENRDLWQVLQLLHKEENRLTSVGILFSYVCGFVLVLWAVSMREKSYIGYIICIGFLLFSLMNIILLVREKNKREHYQKKQEEILAQYGVEKGEAYQITNLDEK